MEELISAALGLSPVDLLIHGRMVDVYRGVVTESYIGVKGDRIAYVGKRPTRCRRRLNVDSGYILPAYIDGHIHIESTMMIPSRFAAAVIPRGTCCVVADPHEIANVMGVEGIRFMIEDSRRTPLRVYFMIPSSVPATNLETSGAEIGLKEIEQLKHLDEVLGLGEVMNFHGVISGERSILSKIEACRGMVIDGHAPGLRGAELSAYAAAGIGSDHESISLDEASEKLSMGMWIMVREGSTSKNLHSLVGLISKGTPKRLMLVTDDRDARDLLREGHIDHCLRRAVEEGIDPVDAVRLVTIKPAEYFGLRLLGGIAPGRWADIVVVDDLEGFNARYVFIGGRIVARDGVYTGVLEGELPKIACKKTVNIGEIHPEDLTITYHADEAHVRVIGLIEGELYTDELHYLMKVTDGMVQADPDRDIAKVCVIERHRGTKRMGKGFVKGFNLREGAIASTVAHDSHNLIVLGTNDADMHAAVKRIIRMGGGLVAVSDGKILRSLPLPVAGLMSTEGAEFVAERMEGLHRAVRSLGCRLEAPFMALSFLSLPVIPKLKITDYGLIDVERFRVVSLFLE